MKHYLDKNEEENVEIQNGMKFTETALDKLSELRGRWRCEYSTTVCKAFFVCEDLYKQRINSLIKVGRGEGDEEDKERVVDWIIALIERFRCKDRVMKNIYKGE